MMTVWTGFLLLLCATYSYQKESGHLSDRANNIIQNPLESANIEWATVNGVLSSCYKNFTGLVFDESYVVARFPPYNIEACIKLCQQTEGCSTLHLIYGVDYTEGCTLFRAGAPALIAPMETGNTTCDANQEGCIKKEQSFDGTYRIFILPNKMQNYPYNGGKGSAGCQKYCQTYSGQNGFLHDDIDWKKTSKFVKEDFPNGKVPCGFFTYYEAWTDTCLIFTEGAKSTPVVKIAGPTSKCEEKRLEQLEKSVHSHVFNDLKGLVYSKEHQIKYYPYVGNPFDCRKACRETTGCKDYLSANGLPYNSGCYLFKTGARQEQISVKSGSWSCSSANCRSDNSTYGKHYEIFLQPDYDFKGHGIEDCKNFCKDHVGNTNGFQSHEVDWDKTFVVVNKNKDFLKCGYYTYIDKTWFGQKQCILFSEGTKPQLVWFRG